MLHYIPKHLLLLMAVLLVGCRTTTSDKEASSKAPFSANTMGEILKLVQANGDFDKNLRFIIGLVIDVDGSVIEAEVVQSSDARYNASLIKYAKSLTFDPPMKDGKPVKARYDMPIYLSGNK